MCFDIMEESLLCVSAVGVSCQMHLIIDRYVPDLHHTHQKTSLKAETDM